MSDDFISLKILIVSEVAPERELLRRASAQVPIPDRSFRARGPRDPVAMGELLARREFRRGVLRFPDCQARAAGLLNVIRAAPSRRWRF